MSQPRHVLTEQDRRAIVRAVIDHNRPTSEVARNWRVTRERVHQLLRLAGYRRVARWEPAP